MSDEETSYLMDIFCNELPYPSINDIERMVDILKRMKIHVPSNLYSKSINEQQQILCGLLQKNKLYIQKCKDDENSVYVDNECININKLVDKLQNKDYKARFSPDQILRIYTLQKVLNNPDEYECAYFKDYPSYCKERKLTINNKSLNMCVYNAESWYDKYLSFKSDTSCLVDKKSLSILHKECSKNIDASRKMLASIFMEIVNNEFETRIQQEVDLFDYFKFKKDAKELIELFKSIVQYKSSEEICEELAMYNQLFDPSFISSSVNYLNDKTKKIKDTIDEKSTQTYDTIKESLKDVVLSMKKIGITNFMLIKTNCLLKYLGIEYFTAQSILKALRYIKGIPEIDLFYAELLAIVLNISIGFIENTQISFSFWFFVFPAGKIALKEMFSNPGSLIGYFLLLELSMDNKKQQESELVLGNLLSLVHKFGIDIPQISSILGKVEYNDTLMTKEGLARFVVTLGLPHVAKMAATKLGSVISSNITNNIKRMKDGKINSIDGIKKLDNAISKIKKKGIQALDV